MLDELIGGPAAALTAVALVVAPGARASGWGVRAALELAARWRGPRRILLADLDLEQPAIHDAAGVPNDEGVIDLVDYGVSLGRLISSAGNGAYDVLSAGIFTPDPGAVLRHPGWNRVLLEVATRRATLLAWVPSDADGLEAVVERSGAVIVLGDADEGREVVERLPHPYAVLAILTPAVEPEPEQAAATDDAPDVADVPAADNADRDVPDQPVAGEPTSDAERAIEPASEPSDVEQALEPASEPSDPEQALEPAAEPAAQAPAAEVPVPTAEDIETARLIADPAAREAMSAELRERQRAARLAGAAPAPSTGVATGAGASAAPPAPVATPQEFSVAANHAGASRRPASTADRSATAAGAAAGAGPGMAAPAGVADAPGAAAGPDTAGASGKAATPGSATAKPRPETGAPIRPPLRQRFRRPVVWTIGVVLLVSLLAGAWHFLGNWLASPDAALSGQPEAPAADPEPPTAAPTEQNALPFVVAIEAHRDLITALNRVTDLSEMEPELLFHIESLERQGTMFYHVMAGPVADSATAMALRDTLIARGHKTGATPTDVRITPLAFLIGDYGTLEAADEQRELLRRLDIPGYVLTGEAADGRPLYRLYVGGFTSAAEGDVVGQMLRAAGIRDSLVTRTGIITPGASLVPLPDSTAAGDSIVARMDGMTAADQLATRTGSSSL